MGLTCKELLELCPLRSLKLVGGESGLDHVVDWVYFADVINDISDSVNWINGNEMLIITGSAMNGKYDLLLHMLPVLSAQSISGVIINVGPYFGDIPDKLIELADQLAMPLFMLPWNVKLVDVTRAICNAIISREIQERESDNVLDALIFQPTPSQERLSQFMPRVGILSDYPYSVGIIHVASECVPIDVSRARDLNNHLVYYANMELNRRTPKSFVAFRDDRLVFLTPGASCAQMEDSLRSLVALFGERYPDVVLHIGVGKAYKRVEQLPLSYRQAKQALMEAQSGGNEPAIAFFNDTDVFNLFLNSPDSDFPAQFAAETLRPLREYDKANNGELLPTLECYFNNNMQLQETSNRLFIHKNTLKYRLAKIEELLSCDIRMPRTIATLYIAVKLASMLDG